MAVGIKMGGFYGAGGGSGYPIGNVTGLRTEVGNKAVKIFWSDPADSVSPDGDSIRWAGTKLVYKKGSYPISPTDGTEAVTNRVRDYYKETGFEVTGLTNDETYYFALFPFTADEIFTSDRANMIAVFLEFWLYGYDMDLNNSDPDAWITYPADVMNKGYTPAHMNFETGKFELGSWKLEPGQQFMPKPCMLRYDGTVAYYLNPANYKQKEDGSPSDIADFSFSGNAMMEWGKIYVSRTLSGNTRKVRISNVKIDETYECWSNYDRADHKIDHFYTSIYLSSLSGGKFRSISEKPNSVSTTAEQEITYAKANGEDWYIETIADRKLLEDLCVLLTKSTSSQTKYGDGRCSSSSAIATGTMDGEGLFFGSNDRTSGVKVFGMENPWGNLWRRVAGYILANGQLKIKLTRGKKDGSMANDFNLEGNGYIDIADGTPYGGSGGYITSMIHTKYGSFAKATNGADNKYWCDGCWYDNGIKAVAIIGGEFGGALLAGVFFTGLNAASSFTYIGLGAALSCKPAKREA